MIDNALDIGKRNEGTMRSLSIWNCELSKKLGGLEANNHWTKGLWLGGHFLSQEIGGGDTIGLSNQSFENNEFLSWMVVEMGMKVSNCMSLIHVNLVGQGAIRKT
jgi:hypothetical protein